jgi:RNA polymerase sigma-70 factor (ECF subfamily)
MFELLVRDHVQALHVFLRAQTRDAAVADDLLQETLLAAWHALDHFDPERAFGPWLRGIARNLVRNHRSRRVREQVVASDAWADLLEEHCAALQRLRNDRLDEQLTQLRLCLDSLPTTYRTAIECRYRDGLRGAALQQRLQITCEAMLKRLQRGRQMLADCLQRQLAAPGRGA